MVESEIWCIISPPLSRWGLGLSPLVASVGPYIIDLRTRIGWRNFCVYFTTALAVHEICQIYPRQEFNYWLSPNKVLRAPLSSVDDLFQNRLIKLVPSWFMALPLSRRARDKYQVTAWNNIFSDNEIFRKRVITITAILAVQRGSPATSAFIKIFSVGTIVLSGSFGYCVILTIDFVRNFLTDRKPNVISIPVTYPLPPPFPKKRKNCILILLRPYLKIENEVCH